MIYKFFLQHRSSNATHQVWFIFLRYLLLIFIYLPLSSLQSSEILLPKHRAITSALAFENKLNYFEAITEYLRASYFLEKSALTGVAETQLKIAQLYFLSGNYSKAMHYNKLATSHNQTNNREPLCKQLYLQKLDLTIASHQNVWSKVKSVPSCFVNSVTVKEKERMRLVTSSWFVREKKLQSAKVLMSIEMKNEHYNNSRKRFLTYLRRPIEHVSSLNTLWALFPGGGFFRFGKIVSGLKSFVTVSSLATLSAVLWVNSMPVGGLISALLGSRYYFASWSETLKLIENKNHVFRNNYFTSLEKSLGESRYQSQLSFRQTF